MVPPGGSPPTSPRPSRKPLATDRSASFGSKKSGRLERGASPKQAATKEREREEEREQKEEEQADSDGAADGGSPEPGAEPSTGGAELVSPALNPSPPPLRPTASPPVVSVAAASAPGERGSARPPSVRAAKSAGPRAGGGSDQSAPLPSRSKSGAAAPLSNGRNPSPGKRGSSPPKQGSLMAERIQDVSSKAGALPAGRDEKPAAPVLPTLSASSEASPNAAEANGKASQRGNTPSSARRGSATQPARPTTPRMKFHSGR